MTRLSRLLALTFVVGCGSADYGPPSSSTTVGLQESPGFGLPSADRGVRIEGTTATYSANSKTEQATIATSDVAAIIHALEDAEFLDLARDYTTCEREASDAESRTIDASLSAGTNTVNHYLGCSGGTFDQLENLEKRIFDLSGFTAWVATQ